VSRARDLLLLVGAMAASTLTTGCELLFLLAIDDDDPPPEEWVDEWEDPVAPTVDLAIAVWPPIGPTGTVEVSASSPAGLSSATFWFRNRADVSLNGGISERFSVDGTSLGDGRGQLVVEVTGFDGARTTRYVDDLLVDLGAPVAYLDAAVLPSTDAKLRFWIGDAWVVSGYRMLIGGKLFEHTLPEGYPPTFGTEWDFSLVSIPVEEIPPGVHLAELEVYDAAGNVTQASVPITIDDVPPIALIESPLEGAEVSGLFDVRLFGADSLPGLVSLELYAGGAEVATATGPQSIVTLDANELPQGSLRLDAIAVDQAGNRSEAASRTVIVVHTP
jgi:hypothetical protein